MTGDLSIGVDVGGTTIKAVLANSQGHILASQRKPTPHNVDTIIADALTLRQQLLSTISSDEASVESPTLPTIPCGFVVPGIVDESSGIGLFSANLGWANVPFKELLADRLLALGSPLPPLAFGHDVRAGLLAEARWGAAQSAQSVVFIAIGTGISGALILDGHLMSGQGYAGEIGHLLIDENGEQCGCGRYGCLETVASASAISRRYAASSSTTPRGSLDVLRHAHDGDKTAIDIVARATESLGRSIASVLTIVGEAKVVIGGGLAEAGEAILDAIRESCETTLWTGRPIDLAHAALGDQAGALGAAALAFDAANAQTVRS